MANTGFKGVDVRQTGNQLVFRAFMQTGAGALETAGPVTVKLYELQSDGTILSYDFFSNTFKSTALTTETLSLTYRKGNNATTDTGLWTAALATLTGFTAGGIYFALFRDAGALPTEQMREFQYGSAEGDLLVTAGTTGQAYLQNDVREWGGAAVNALISGRVDASVGALAAAVITAASIAAAALNGKGDWSTYAGGAVASVTGNVGGNVVGSVGSVTSGVTLLSTALDAILIESGITPSASLTDDSGAQLSAINARQALAAILSAMAGVLAQADTNPTTKPAGKPLGNTRLSVTADALNNRSAVTIKVPT